MLRSLEKDAKKFEDDSILNNSIVENKTKDLQEMEIKKHLKNKRKDR